jgi:hyperosmotically inducible periplasmic protein
MFNQKQNAGPVSALPVGSTGSNVVSISSRTSQEVMEARLESQIWTTFALSPYLRATDIKVSVRDGVATLTGNVTEGVNKELAEQIARGVEGIKSVENQLNVTPVQNASPALRGFGDTVDDASIVLVVKSKLGWSRHAGGLDVKVESMQGRVKLAGLANCQDAKDMAAKIARTTLGVRSIDNQILVDAGKASATMDDGSDFGDAWITMKVKATFLYSSKVHGSEIEVSTHDGNVRLAGHVESGAARALAAELARNVRGVKNVDTSSLTA